MQGVYQWLLNKESASAITDHIRNAHGFDKADATHFAGLVTGTIADAEALRERLSSMLDRPIADLSPVEHAILLIGAHELASHPDIPYRVVINEAVELAKSFGGIDGHKFVNGVLDKLAAKIRHEEVLSDRQP